MGAVASSSCASADAPRLGTGRAGQVCLARPRHEAFRGGSRRCSQDSGRPCVAAAPATLRTIHRPSLLITDFACPELRGLAGLRCLLGRRAMTNSLYWSCSRIALWDPPTSSSLADRKRVCSLLLRSAARNCRRSQLGIEHISQIQSRMLVGRPGTFGVR